jgi:group I intron endonuclease
VIKNNKISGIYKITCKKTGKFYIGSSVNINKRLNEHKRILRQNKHSNKYLQNTWNRYREQNFRFEIIEIIHDISQLLIREQWWLDNTKCYDEKIGFNNSINAMAPNTGKFIDLTGKKFGKLIVKKKYKVIK